MGSGGKMESAQSNTPESSIESSLGEDFPKRVLASLPVSIFVYCLVCRDMIYWNRTLLKELGYDHALGTGAVEEHTLIHPDDRESTMQAEQFLERSEIGAKTHFEMRLHHADGTWRWYGGMVTVFERDTDARPKSLIGVITEVTRIKQVEEQLRHDAGHDSLTGLFNRRQFTEELRKRITANIYPMALCLCDLDHFKTINDTYGHAAGDEALSAFAQILRSNVRKEDVVARLGGDEFCVLLSGHSMQEAKPLLDRIRHEFSQREFLIGGSRFSVTASFGVTEYAFGMTVESLLKNADEALYRSKSLGRNEVSSSQN